SPPPATSVRTIQGQWAGLGRTQKAVHFDLSPLALEGQRASMSVFIGVSRLEVTQSWVTALSVREQGSSAVVAGVETQTGKNTALGLGGGVEGTMYLIGAVGVGGGVRYSRGAVETNSGAVKTNLILGGAQVSMGLRLRFGS